MSYLFPELGPEEFVYIALFSAVGLVLALVTGLVEWIKDKDWL